MTASSVHPNNSLSSEQPLAPPEPGTAVPSGRRAMLRAAAAAVGGAAAATMLTARPVGAADNDPVLMGNSHAAPSRTSLRYDGPAISTAFSFTTSTPPAIVPLGMDVPAATLAGTGGTNVRSGVRGSTNFSDGYAIAARNYSTNGVALHAQSRQGNAVEGEALSGGAGVRGSGKVGVLGEATHDGVPDELDAGVVGFGYSGVVGLGERYALQAYVGQGAALFLRTTNDFIASSPKLPPPQRTDEHQAGEVDTDSNGDLWYCAISGQPGTWLKLAGPSAAGSFHPITPIRTYDSRRPAPSPGVLATGDSRLISVKDGRLKATGAVSAVDAVPVGATAVAYNLTVTDTAGQGWLAVAAGSVTSTETSAVNWPAAGTTVANAGLVQVDESRQVKVFCGGVGSTNFVLDVTGYWL